MLFIQWWGKHHTTKTCHKELCHRYATEYVMIIPDSNVCQEEGNVHDFLTTLYHKIRCSRPVFQLVSECGITVASVMTKLTGTVMSE